MRDSGWMEQTGRDELGGWQLGGTYDMGGGMVDTVLAFVTRLDWRGTCVQVLRREGRDWEHIVEHATPRGLGGNRIERLVA